MNLLSRSQAAKFLGISVRTLDRRIADGKIRSYKLGEGLNSSVRIGQEELDAYLAMSILRPAKSLRDEARTLLDKQGTN
jgi:excisionase family DNA binding protein